MGYTRDSDRATRGVGAVAASDMVSSTARYQRVQVGRATRARDRLMAAVASGALGAVNTDTPDRQRPGGSRTPARTPTRGPAPKAPPKAPAPHPVSTGGGSGTKTIRTGGVYHSPTISMPPPPPAAIPPGFEPGVSKIPPGAIIRDHRGDAPPVTKDTPVIPPGTVVPPPNTTPIVGGGAGSGGGGIVRGPGGQPIVIPPGFELPDTPEGVTSGSTIAGYPTTTVLLVGGVAVLGAYLLFKDRSGS